MNSTRRHFNYANVVATLALGFAMSGGALAATHYAINSSKQINPKVLKSLKGSKGATGAAGANGAQGPGGAIGPQGPGGSAGPSGISGYQIVQGPVAPGEGVGFNFARSKAKCPSGKKVLGGGFLTPTGENGRIYVAEDGPNTSGEWEVITGSATTGAYTMASYAICANVTS
jgi:hypothetical protein